MIWAPPVPGSAPLAQNKQPLVKESIDLGPQPQRHFAFPLGMHVGPEDANYYVTPVSQGIPLTSRHGHGDAFALQMIGAPPVPPSGPLTQNKQSLVKESIDLGP